jgi:predicted metal-dependent hydrolase
MTSIERSEVNYGSTRIEYAIRRSPRRRTVSIAVLPGDGVLLTAPTRTSVPRLDQLVHEKAQWIVERLRAKREVVESKTQREFVSGESFTYLGRQYRLRVVVGEPAPLRLKSGWLHVHVPRGLGDQHKGGYVRAALTDWYRKRAGERIPEAVARWSQKVGVPVPTVLVREQQKRWASCHPGGIVRVNWRIIQAGPNLIDYVLAHEIVRLVHDDHSSDFWRTLGRIMPDYEGRRAELRRVGARFEW